METNNDQSTEAVIFTDAAAMKVGTLLTEEEKKQLIETVAEIEEPVKKQISTETKKEEEEDGIQKTTK